MIRLLRRPTGGPEKDGSPYPRPASSPGARWYTRAESNLQRVPRGRDAISEQAGLHGDTDTEGHAQLRERLVRAVRAVSPPWMADRRDDLVQMAMMAVLEQQKKRAEKKSFPNAYLRRAAYTAFIDEFRRLHSDRETPLEYAAASAVTPRHEDPERQTLSREISSSVRGCLGHLATPRRKAVTFYLLSYKVPEIAKRLGWTRKRAENLVYRGLGDLRRCLKTRGITP